MDAAAYAAAQIVGGVLGSVLANLMYSLPAVTLSSTSRSAPNLWLGEVVATAGLVLVITVLVRTDRTTLVPPAVGAYIGAAYWFTSSTSFANPAVTIGRMFSDTFAGISPASAPAFIACQFVGGIVGVAVLTTLYPQAIRLDPAWASARRE
jgi:arsenate reductase